MPAPSTECWLHPAVTVRASRIEGRGLIATADLPEGTVVARLGGRLVDAAEMRRLAADAGFVVTCRCGSDLCRGIVTGEDWRRPDLQERYGGHWVPALLELIRLAGGSPRT